MNEKTFKKLRSLKQTIKFNSLTGNKSNVFHYFKNNTDLHEDTKYFVFKELIKRGYEVYTEVEFNNSCGRADVVAFDLTNGEGYIIEIIQTESQISIENKKLKYPSNFDFITIDCSKEAIEIPI